MTFYLIASLEPHDSRYDDYMEAGNRSLAGVNYRALVADNSPQVLEGTLPGTRVVMLEFASRLEFEAWWYSEEYVDAKQLRFAGATTRFIALVEGKSLS